MPTISPQTRSFIGGSQDDVRPTRASITAPNTGMNLPVNTEGKVSTDQKTGQPVTTEDTTAPVVTLSPQLTALARKQQKLEAEIRAQREREVEWEKKQADFIPKSSFKAKAEQNALEALKDLGLNYEDLTSLLISQSEGADPVKALESKIERLEKSQQENTDKQFEATVNQYRSEAKKNILSNDKYLALRHEIAQNPDVLKAITDELLDDWKNKDEVQDITYYIDLAEDAVREHAKEAADLLKKLEPPKEETPEPAAKKQLPPPKQTMKTLTQQVESAPTRTYNQFQHLSPKERLAQAIARAQR